MTKSKLQKLLGVVSCFGWLLGWSPAVAQDQSVNLPLSDLLSGAAVSGTVNLSDVTSAVGRCEIAIVVEAPQLWADLDALGRARGNMGGFSDRLYWVGPTSLRSVGADNSIYLTSSARYESWIRVDLLFDELVTKVLQDTKTVDFVLRPAWDAAANQLIMTYEIENIRNFPGEVESLLRALGVDFGGRMTLMRPAGGALGDLAPEIVAGPTFAASEAGLSVTAVISMILPNLEIDGWLLANSCSALRVLLSQNPEQAQVMLTELIDQL